MTVRFSIGIDIGIAVEINMDIALKDSALHLNYQ